MKNIIAALALAATLGFASIAHAGFVETAFGNTVTVANADGDIQVSFLFDDGGSFTAVQADGQTGTGTWRQNGSELCLSFGEGEECHEVQDIAVGENWSDMNDDGSSNVISIVAGR